MSPNVPVVTDVASPYKANCRFAGAGNVGEGGVGASVVTDLAALAAYSYNPVRRRLGFLYFSSKFLYISCFIY